MTDEQRNPSDSDATLSFGEETVVLTRRWGYDTRIVAMRLLDENLPLVEIAQAVGREAADVLNFAIRCAPKLRALAPNSARPRLASRGA